MSLVLHIVRKYGEWLMIINRGRGESQQPNWGKVHAVTVYGVEFQWRRITATAPKLARGGQLVPIAGWLDDATLCVVTTPEAAVIARNVGVDGFEFSQKSP
jgi:hypothetical protein